MEEKLTLKEIAYMLLNKWYSAEDAWLWEASGDINRDEERLEARFKYYQKKIEEASKENCRKCWDREMPEKEEKAEEPVEIKIEEEKKMRSLGDVIRDAVLNAINDSDIEYAVKECFENHDYSDMIERAVENYLYENIEDIADDIVTEAVRDYMRDNL